ncbi:hypothetical protein CONCODRAFT_3174 [Conidiobolus coronatus NRRL 28638]|uniref:Uncharacterized protein n=1 Tax=Conidiobolus coronatus (strain ATCC 28846 / CBS 209.66 / NRRL 28638) TaxID=796925 RepID=A0A137PFI9_CONC2|nr:hypothetical protein CONCODRAFT_3174 [Conidiobolus coronatus NRRL 28638]|eukprot:KXN73767.1 hypothetical protein CONCODRAFT_3174 [Conidiobolus coronatus NRRL 28638]
MFQKFFSTLVALTAFVAAHDGPHDAMGNALDNNGNLIGFVNGTKPAYPIPPSEQAKLFGNNQANKQYPLPSTQQQPQQPQQQPAKKPLLMELLNMFKKFTGGSYGGYSNNLQQPAQPHYQSNDNKTPNYNQY